MSVYVISFFTKILGQNALSVLKNMLRFLGRHAVEPAGRPAQGDGGRVSGLPQLPGEARVGRRHRGPGHAGRGARQGAVIDKK